MLWKLLWLRRTWKIVHFLVSRASFSQNGYVLMLSETVCMPSKGCRVVRHLWHAGQWLSAWVLRGHIAWNMFQWKKSILVCHEHADKSSNKSPHTLLHCTFAFVILFYYSKVLKKGGHFDQIKPLFVSNMYNFMGGVVAADEGSSYLTGPKKELCVLYGRNVSQWPHSFKQHADAKEGWTACQ